MYTKFSSVLIITILLFFVSCKDSLENDLPELQALNDSIKKVYAPDKRVAVYNIHLAVLADQVKITGETDQEQALATLMEMLKNKGKKIENSVSMLPDSSVGGMEVTQQARESLQNILESWPHRPFLALH